MAQPSILQPVGGPLAGLRFEFYGNEVLIGTAPECGVRVDAQGVAERHARIVIDLTGATILRVDGIVGVNDDVVLGDSLLRSGDFVWLGEPGGATSIMLQFTLGDGEAAVEAQAEAPVEMVAEEATFEEAPQEEAAPHGADAEVVEMAPEGLEPQDLEQIQHVEEPAVLEPAPVEEAVVEELAEPMLAETPQVEEAQFEEAHYEEPQLAEPAMVAEVSPEFATHEIESASEIESMAEIEPDVHAPDDLAPVPATAPPPAKSVPPAPWLTPAPSEAAAAPVADYASSWEPAPKAPAPEEQEATLLLPASPVASPRPAAPPPDTPPPAAKPVPPVTPAPPPRRPAAPPTQTGSTPRPKPKTEGMAPPTPREAPPAPSSVPMIVGGLVALVVLGGVGYLMFGSSEAPAPPAPTPVPTVAVAATPAPVAPTLEPEPTPVAVVEATPEPPPVAAPPTPTPRAGTTPSPRATPTPRATPPASTPRPGTAAAPTPAATVAAPAAPAAPVSQAPKLLDDARAALASKDFARADQILDQVLRLEPGNAEATTRKAEVAARLATLARKFVMGATSVIGGKAAKGPTGFDLGGGAVVKTDFSAQIRCTSTPATVEEGTLYTVRCAIVNIGTKAFRLESVAANETRDGAKTAGSGTTPRGDLAPQSETGIVEKTGAWSAKSQWSLEIVAKTNKEESFRAVYNWR